MEMIVMKKLHPCWAVCIGCALAMFISCGLLVNAYTAVQPYILQENGFTNTQTSAIVTIRSVVNVTAIFLLPLFFRKTGYRLGLTLCTLLGAAANVIFAFAKTLFTYYIAAAVAGLSYGLGCMIPITLLLSRWFHEKRGLALGICSGGTGLATVALSPVLTRLIEIYGLRTCFLFEAAFCAVFAVFVFLLVREDPESCGILPYGETSVQAHRQVTGTAVSLGALHRALLFLGTLFLGCCTTVGFTHMAILFTTAGFDAMRAGTAVSVFGLMLMLGKFVLGDACDRLGGYRANFVFSGIMAAGILLCMTAGLRSSFLMFAAAAIYGFGCPVSTVGISIWAGDFSTPKTYQKNLQLLQLGYAMGALVFGTMPGMLADRFGSYVPAYLVILIFCILFVLIIQGTYIYLAKKEGKAL